MIGLNSRGTFEMDESMNKMLDEYLNAWIYRQSGSGKKIMNKYCETDEIEEQMKWWITEIDKDE